MPSIPFTQTLVRSAQWVVSLLALWAACACQPVLAQAGDPPGVVAWLGQTRGEVSFAPANTDTWAYALPNRPLTTGDQLWVERGGRAELHVGSTAVRLGPQTELAFTTLDERTMQWRLSQGSLEVHVRALFSDQRVEVDTPNLAFVPSRPGDYRIDVDPASGTTSVSNWSGEAAVYGQSGFSEDIDDRARMTYSGADLSREDETLNPPADDLDRWAWARDDQESRSTSARYVSREVTGYAALDNHGTWTSDPAYGPVWIPTTVAPGWAPYHDGHWAWIDPWGWTWVDDAPWGFAPFHYGRWAWLSAQAHWAWVPGPVLVTRPVYAPALVAFVSDGGGGTRWGVSLSSGAPGVAWLPLAPGEVYTPGYHASPHYVTRINQTIVVRNTTVNTTNVYVNQQAPHAVAVVPSSAFVRGQHVHGSEGHLPVDVLRHAHFQPTAGVAPIVQSRLGNAHRAPPHAMVNMPVVQADPRSAQAVQRGYGQHGQAMAPAPRPHAAERNPVNLRPEDFPPPAAGPSFPRNVRPHEAPRPPHHPAAPSAVSPNEQPAPVVRAPAPPRSSTAPQPSPPQRPREARPGTERVERGERPDRTGRFEERLDVPDRRAWEPPRHPHPAPQPAVAMPTQPSQLPQPTQATPPPPSQAPQGDHAHGHRGHDKEADQHPH